MTLGRALISSESLLAKAVLVLGGTALIAAAAQVSVPMFPVPMTLQTLAILLVGFAYGSRLGAVTLIAYLAEGAMGLPVFAGGASAPALAGPTAGFLFGFVGVAFLAGLAADRGVKRVVPLALVALGASAALYIPGLLWPAMTMGVPADKLVAGWMAPFLAGDAVKAVLAAMMIAGGWAAARR